MHPAEHADLGWLLAQVVRARDAVDSQRTSVVGSRSSSDDARHRLLHALEAYADGLATENCPVPYKLRDELNLQRRLSST